MKRMGQEAVEICAEFVAETDKAIFITDTDDPEDGEWIPKSQIDVMEPEYPTRGDMIEFEIPEWLAKAKNLI